MTTNRTTQQDRDRKMIAAIKQHLSSQQAIVIRGVTYTPDSLVEVVQADLNTADVATQAKSKLKDASAAAKASRAKLRTFITGFRAYLLNMFTDAAVITDFGFTPQKTVTKTVAVKAVAATKVVATRKARNTLGKVQKKNIKGTVTTTGGATAGAPAAPAATGGGATVVSKGA